MKSSSMAKSASARLGSNSLTSAIVIVMIAVVVMTFLFAITVVIGCVFGCVKCFKYSVRAARRQKHPQSSAPGAAVNEHMVQFPSNEKLMLA